MAAPEEYDADVESDDPWRQLRAYAHDVRRHKERFGGAFNADLDDLLSLIDTLVDEEGGIPSRYAEEDDECTGQPVLTLRPDRGADRPINHPTQPLGGTDLPGKESR